MKHAVLTTLYRMTALQDLSSDYSALKRRSEEVDLQLRAALSNAASLMAESAMANQRERAATMDAHLIREELATAKELAATRSSELESAAALNTRLTVEKENITQQLSVADSNTCSLRSEIAALQNLLALREAAVARAAESEQVLRTDLGFAKKQASMRDADIARIEATNAALSNDLRVVTQDASLLKADLTRTNQAFAELQAELNNAKLRAAQDNAELARSSSALSALSDELAKTKAAQLSAEHASATATEHLAHCQRKLEHLEAQYKSLVADLSVLEDNSVRNAEAQAAAVAEYSASIAAVGAPIPRTPAPPRAHTPMRRSPKLESTTFTNVPWRSPMARVPAPSLPSTTATRKTTSSKHIV